MVRNGKREALPIDRVEITKDTIGDAKSQFQVRVLFIVFRAHVGMSAGDGLEHGLVGLVTGARGLNGEVEKGLGAEVSLVLESRDHNEATDRNI